MKSFFTVSLAASDRRLLVDILGAVNSLKLEILKMAGELDTLKADVAAESTVIASAVTLLQGLKAALDAAIASGDPQALKDLSAKIEADTASLAGAVAANTPAA